MSMAEDQRITIICVKKAVILNKIAILLAIVLFALWTVSVAEPYKVYVNPFSRSRFVLGDDGVLLVRIILLMLLSPFLYHLAKLIVNLCKSWLIEFNESEILANDLRSNKSVPWECIEKIVLKVRKNKISEKSEIFSIKLTRKSHVDENANFYVYGSGLKVSELLEILDIYKPELRSKTTW